MNHPPKLLGSVLLAVCDLKDTKGSSIDQITKYLKTKNKRNDFPSTEKAIFSEISKALNYGRKYSLLAAHGKKFRMSPKFLNPTEYSAKNKKIRRQKANNDDLDTNMPIQKGKRRRKKTSKSRKSRRRTRRTRRKRSNPESGNNDAKMTEAKRRGRRGSKRSRSRKSKNKESKRSRSRESERSRSRRRRSKGSKRSRSRESKRNRSRESRRGRSRGSRSSRTRSRSLQETTLGNMNYNENATEPIASEDRNEEATSEELVYPDDSPNTQNFEQNDES